MLLRRCVSSLRTHILPLGVFLMAFCSVMALLVLSMNFTDLKYRKRLNWTGNVDLSNIPQDNPQFIDYIRSVHIESPSRIQQQNTKISNIVPPQTKLVAKLLDYKKNGIFVEAGAYRKKQPSDTEWLESRLQWNGLLIQPDPQDYTILRNRGRCRAFTIHACISPTSYPKEATFLHVVQNTEMVYMTVKCFPLLSLLLAANATSVDFLSLRAEGAELQVLKTLPFSRVSIKLVSIERQVSKEHETEEAIFAFMSTNKYDLIATFPSCHVFKYQNFIPSAHS